MATLLASAARLFSHDLCEGLELELYTDTQFATAYLDGAPVATVQRRRVLGEEHLPIWRAFDTRGEEIGHASGARAICRHVANHAQGVRAYQEAKARREAISRGPLERGGNCRTGA